MSSSNNKEMSLVPRALKDRRLHSILIISFLVALFVIVLVRTAWTMDDSWITFRVIDNFINGYGLTWNTDERVQVFTHPLWMFVLSFFYYFTHELYYTSIIVSIVISVASILFFAIKITRSTMIAAFGITILIFSKAFTDFSTSGLENPLTHLFLAVFLFIYFKREMNVRTLFFLSLIASLAAFNRADTILLFIPVVVYGLFKLRKVKALFTVIIGFIPFIAWEVFALFYYGDLLANPSYAKVISTGISRVEIAVQGLYYLFNSINMDHITLVVIAAGIVLPFLKKEWRSMPVIAGVSLYLFFIVIIGGDFMSGRMLTAPLFVAVILLSQTKLISRLAGEQGPAIIDRRIWLLPFFVVIFLSISSPHPSLLSGEDYGSRPDWGEKWDAKLIADDRAFHYPASGLLRAAGNDEWPNHVWRFEGEKARESGKSVIVFPFVGYYGFYAGPKVHVVDTLGITEPFLGRLPAINKFTGDPNWRVGHIEHMIPQGYIETLETGQNKIADKNLALYYDKQSLIIRGDLFDGNRISEIINMNLGKYKYLIDAYVEEQSNILHVNLEDINTPKVEGTPWDALGNMIFFQRGIEINLGKEFNSKHIEISLDNGDDYQIIYVKMNNEVQSQNIPANPIPGGGLHVRLVEVPLEAAESGYDAIRILPIRGDMKYSVGHIRMLDETEYLDLSKIFVFVQKSSIGYNDTQTWNSKGLPSYANYAVTIRGDKIAIVLGTGTADVNGEANGSFLVGSNLLPGTQDLRIELTADPKIFGEISFNLDSRLK